MKKPVVIIPSIRTIEADRIAAIPEDVDIFVVDDSDGNIKKSRDNIRSSPTTTNARSWARITI
jgi:hypothetical protein